VPLPGLDLDDRTWADLVLEVKNLIPGYAPDWTDQNPSDPGITLVELFAWLTEMLIFRTDQVPDRHIIAFLRLLNGPGWTWQPTGNPAVDSLALAAEVRATDGRLRSTTRAITTDDFAILALQTNAGDPTVPQVARATCVPRRHLDASLYTDRPGHLTVVVVPDRALLPPQTDSLQAAVQTYLERWRLLTTQIHVTGPLYAPFRIEVQVAPNVGVTEDVVTGKIGSRLAQLFDPSSAEPWPFGRSVFVSGLYGELAALPEIDYIAALELDPVDTGDLGTMPATELWNDDGDLVGLGLGPYQLPKLSDGQVSVYVSRTFVAIDIEISVQVKPDSSPALVRRSVKAALRAFFHPASPETPNGPTGTAPWGPIPFDDVRAAVLRAVPEVVNVLPPTVHTTPNRNDAANRQLTLLQGEFAELQTTVTVV
jgi:hypothetical protein